MKIGILTFHNGTNYGGTLQAFATQKTIEALGHEALIVTYAPLSFRDRFYKCFTSSIKWRNIRSYLLDYFKEPEFRKFRNLYMNLSPRYYTEKDVIDNLSTLNLDACISGSDQVWSPYMAQNWGKIYFQHLFPNEIKRIAYAVSFSCSQYPNEAMDIVRDDIAKFSSLSTRENSGKTILESSGFQNIEVMPDPTFLFEKDLLSLLNHDGISELTTKEPEFNDLKDSYVYCYILQQNQKLIHKVSDYYSDLQNSFSFGKVIDSSKLNFRFEGVTEWIARIANSKLVVTNSFHGAVFSLLFHRPFIIIPVEGRLSGMNDRIITLMKTFNLEDRILESYDTQKILSIQNSLIDWKEVDEVIEKMRAKGIGFLERALS